MLDVIIASEERNILVSTLSVFTKQTENGFVSHKLSRETKNNLQMVFVLFITDKLKPGPLLRTGKSWFLPDGVRRIPGVGLLRRHAQSASTGINGGTKVIVLLQCSLTIQLN